MSSSMVPLKRKAGSSSTSSKAWHCVKCQAIIRNQSHSKHNALVHQNRIHISSIVTDKGKSLVLERQPSSFFECLYCDHMAKEPEQIKNHVISCWKSHSNKAAPSRSPSVPLAYSLPTPTSPASSLALSTSSVANSPILNRRYGPDGDFINASLPPIKVESDVTILCACGGTAEHGGLIGCDFCDNWQHTVCYGYLGDSDERIPETFRCYCCKIDQAPKDDKDPHLPDTIASIKEELQWLALTRRLIDWVYFLDRIPVAEDIAWAFETDAGTALYLLKALEQENFILDYRDMKDSSCDVSHCFSGLSKRLSDSSIPTKVLNKSRSQMAIKDKAYFTPSGHLESKIFEQLNNPQPKKPANLKIPLVASYPTHLTPPPTATLFQAMPSFQLYTGRKSSVSPQISQETLNMFQDIEMADPDPSPRMEDTSPLPEVPQILANFADKKKRTIFTIRDDCTRQEWKEKLRAFHEASDEFERVCGV